MVVVLAIIATFGALTAATIYLVGKSPQSILSVTAFIIIECVFEIFLRCIPGSRTKSQARL